uniref:Mitochondrial import receptor subunit TOM7 homolog n=1 Tax=Rhabditophanes sp. KR3021 TaxID=114890 RepID=A0AC35THY8_9BILA
MVIMKLTSNASNNILMFGSGQVSRFDFDKIRWIKVLDMPNSKEYHNTVCFNSYVYIVVDEVSATIRYGERDGQWQRRRWAIFEDYESAICQYDDKIMKAGGSTSLPDSYGHFAPKLNYYFRTKYIMKLTNSQKNFITTTGNGVRIAIQWGFVPFVVYLGMKNGPDPLPNGEVIPITFMNLLWG